MRVPMVETCKGASDASAAKKKKMGDDGSRDRPWKTSGREEWIKLGPALVP